MDTERIDDILTFWFEDIESSSWFRADAAFDQILAERFGKLLTSGRDGKLDAWRDSPRGTLALIILLDQFSRNIHRGTPAAFAADEQALQLTLDGIARKADLDLTLEQRSFFYLPLRHAEDLGMQQLGLEKTRELNVAGYGSDKYALGHLHIIEQFGRFPHRNEILGRANTRAETKYLESSSAGY